MKRPPPPQDWDAVDWGFAVTIVALLGIGVLLVGWLAVLSWPWV